MGRRPSERTRVGGARAEKDLALILRATSELAATPVERRLGGRAPERSVFVVVILVVATLVVAAAALSVSRASAAPTAKKDRAARAAWPRLPDAGALVRVDGAIPPPPDHLMMVTIRVPHTAVRARDASTRLLLRDGRRLMRASVVEARLAAGRCIGQSLSARIDSGAILGSSGGLILALAIIDQATPGDLTSGRRVAATGVIRRDGSVRPVLAVAEKVINARRAGAELFLVPADQARLARQSAGGMRVVGVRGLGDALRALGRPRGCVSR
jgi:PDZ domain-containing secreted protein